MPFSPVFSLQPKLPSARIECGGVMDAPVLGAVAGIAMKIRLEGRENDNAGERNLSSPPILGSFPFYAVAG